MVPKETLLPRCARPRLRPFMTLRNLVRFGCNIVRYPLATAALFRRLGLLFFLCCGLFHATQNLPAEDPHLDTDGAVGGFSAHIRVVDIGTQGVQRHAAFAVPFGTRNLCTAQTAGYLNLDAFGAGFHG